MAKEDFEEGVSRLTDSSSSLELESDRPDPKPEMSADLTPSRAEDVRYAYQLVLGRNPESDAVVAGNQGRALNVVLDELYGSLEFHFNVNQRLLRTRAPNGGLFDAPPSVTLLEWVKTRFPMSEATRQVIVDEVAASGGRGWLTLYQFLFGDSQFADSFGSRLQPSRLAVLEALQATLAVFGEPQVELVIEEAREDEVRGWALDVADPDRRVIVQLFLDDAFAGSIQPDRFRRDLQDRFGGAGHYGFVAIIPFAWRGLSRKVRAEFRDATGGEVLAETQIQSGAPDQSDVYRAIVELGRIREQLTRVEAALPNLQASSSLPLEHYSDYAEFYYTRQLVESPRDDQGPALSILLLVEGESLSELAEWAESLCRQTFRHWTLTIAFSSTAQAERYHDVARQIGWKTGRTTTAVQTDKLAFAAFLAESFDHLLITSEICRLIPGAMSAIAKRFALEPDAALVFGDDDAIDADGRVDDPHLRPALDLDLLIQKPDLGALAGLKRSILVADDLVAKETLEILIARLALRSALKGDTVRHAGRVLTRRTRPLGYDATIWQEISQAALAEAGIVASLTQEGARASGALRVNRPALVKGRRAAVIIPTRDQPDLLESCVESLRASASANETAMDIVVIDNGSKDQAALAHLHALEARRVRILRFDIPFNWALLNNKAADVVEADTFIFLNDDTVVIDQNWCDALCEQAFRPDVGAAGARLLYADGDIQHAGIVLRDPASYAAHEGVGESGADGGYLDRRLLVHETMAVTGACLATRREVFYRLGGFDSVTFPVEGNDVDYCLKARAAGLKVIYTPYATLHHLESKSRGFSLDGEKRAVADKAVADLWKRWGQVFPTDPFFNAHFDRKGRPFADLRPPPRV